MEAVGGDCQGGYGSGCGSDSGGGGGSRGVMVR